MKKHYSILLILLLMVFACTEKNSQSQSLDLSKDSLASYLLKANDFGTSTTTRRDYAQKAYDVISAQPNDSVTRQNLFRVANRYYNLKDWAFYKQTAEVVLEKAEAKNDTMSIAKAYTYLGDYYGAKGVSDSAFGFYFKAEKIYLKHNDNLNIAKTRLNKARLQYNESDFQGSEISVFKALQVLKDTKDNTILFELYNLLGLVYNELGEYDKAIEFLNKALSTIDKETGPIEYQYEATSFNNLGLVYQNMNKDKQAIPYFEKGLEYKKDLLLYKPFVYALLLNNLGYSRFKINENKGLPDLFYKSLKLKESWLLPSGIIASKLNLSEYFYSKKDTVKAMQYAHEAMLTARTSKNDRNVLLVLKHLATINPINANRYNKEYIHINDSLQKADRNIADKFTRIEYETDTIKEENSILTTQNRNLISAFGGLLVIGMFMYVIKTQKAKNRELLYKQEQQRANEEIYNLLILRQNDVENIRVKEKIRVAQELHDGVLGRIFGVRMNLDGLNRFNDESASKQRMDYLIELKNIEQDIREISHDLNREKSELINNFVAIVENLIENQKHTYDAIVNSSIDNTIKWESLSNTTKINLYRILQEALQNCNKYANATAIKIVFKAEMDDLFLEISDDGKGFDVKKTKNGIGLQNMLSRVNECKGVFQIKSQKGEGTKITITVPII